MQRPIVRIDMLSGIRFKSDVPEFRAAEQQLKRKKFMKLFAPLIEDAKKATLFIEDGLANTPAEVIVDKFLVNNVEAFIVRDERDNFIGFHAFENIQVFKHAELHSWSSPDASGIHDRKCKLQSLDEIIAYAFAPWPEGLGLLKIKARVCEENIPTLKICNRFGFVCVGRLMMEALHGGQLRNMLLLELYNPQVVGTGDLIDDNRSTERSAEPPRGVGPDIISGVEPPVDSDGNAVSPDLRRKRGPVGSKHANVKPKPKRNAASPKRK